MTKIEPMSVGEIKQLVSSRDHLRLILAWAHERAQLNEIRYAMSGTKYGEAKIQWNDADWLNEVLDEIGWPKEGR